MKNKIIRSLLLSLTLTFAFSSVFAQSGQPSHRESVFACAYSQCDDSDQSIDCYMTRQTTSNPIVNGKIMKGEFWLVFADLMPEANWEHPCKYIYVSDNMDGGEYAVAVVDSVRPPHSGDFEPMKLSQITRDRMELESSEKAKRAGAARMMKSGPLPIYSTPFSSKTYAVILSGGLSPADNAERYWNDCSYMYKTLTRNFGLPKENVKVLMSDGKSSGLDRNLNSSFSPDLDSSPLDLDGDGECDIDFSASKDTLAMVFDELKNKLTDNDHLLVFVTDHGGYDEYNDKSYINLWNGERLYPDEFASYFNGFNAGYVSFVLGQCYSGGFIPALKADNHIVMTACAEKELSYRCRAFDLNYNEFLYHWISALNRTDTFGNTLPVSQTLPNGKLAPVTLKRAFDYAVEKDAYNKGKTLACVENPQISILGGSTAEDLALDSIPPTVDLCITNYQKDKNDRFLKWANPYIWIRNQNDGKNNQSTENPIVNEDHSWVYIYTKVRNRGVKPYNGNGRHIAYCWTKSSLMITSDMWKGFLNGNYDSEKGIYGNRINSKRITDIINPGDTTIIEKRYYFTDDDFEAVSTSKFNMCVLAFLSAKPNNYEFPVTSDGFADLARSSKLAQNNTLVMAPDLNNYGVLPEVTMLNYKDHENWFSIKVQPDEDTSELFSKAEINLVFSSDIAHSLNDQTLRNDSVYRDYNNFRKFRMLGKSSRINSMHFTANQAELFNLTCNFNAEEEITKPKIYDLNLMVVDENSGDTVGGQRFRIVSKSRKPISASVEKTQVGTGRYSLSLNNVSEDCLYEWYDKNGKLIGSGSSLEIPANSDASEYRVKIMAKSDGAVIYRNVKTSGLQVIDNIVTSRDGLTVNLKTPASNRLQVQLSSVTDTYPIVSKPVEKGEMSCRMEISNFPTGFYQISLLSDGKIIETRKFMK